MIDGWRVYRYGDEFILRQPGTRNSLVLDRAQLAIMFKRYWGFYEKGNY